MARIKTTRKIGGLPIIKGMKPYGSEIEKRDVEPVNLLLEEYEALRLSDYDLLNHHQASEVMKISRPTFTRIYASALRKIALSFVEGRQIFIEGGKIYFDSEWFKCHSCDCFFNNPEKEIPIESCPLCGKAQISNIDIIEQEATDSTGKGCCYCPTCGWEINQTSEATCKHKKCPACDSRMIHRHKNSCNSKAL